mmetsp:Transcript_47399/g.102101  ORF Transcript_47399/g.102101 Transcript_47399/m.102101 type:complete len:268 (-) Transcript_47399:154-957(-)
MSSKVLTGTPAISTMKSPTSKPHFAPRPCNRTTFVSSISTPKGRCIGNSSTMISTKGLLRSTSLSSGTGFTRQKPPSASSSCSMAQAGSFQFTSASLSLRRCHVTRMKAPRAMGAPRKQSKRSRTKMMKMAEPGVRASLTMSKEGPSTSPASPGGSVEVVVVVGSGRYVTSGERTSGHGLAVQAPTMSQQYSVSPEQSSSHMTGYSAGHLARPRWSSQQDQVSILMLQDVPSRHSIMLRRPLSSSQVQVSVTLSRDMEKHSDAVGRK